MNTIEIEPKDTSEVYNRNGITVEWLEEGERDLLGRRVDAVMEVPGRGNISFRANDHHDLQACIDEYLEEHPLEDGQDGQ